MVFGSWQKCLAGSKPTHPGYKIVSQDAGLEKSGVGPKILGLLVLMYCKLRFLDYQTKGTSQEIGADLGAYDFSNCLEFWG